MAEDRTKRAREMRALNQEDREAAIEAADNVFGYERFIEKHKQVALRAAYRKPKNPNGSGIA